MATNIEKLWQYACSGNITELKKYYEQECGEVNRRYERFGHSNSLVMGAFRNRQFETVDYLLDVGEIITRDEDKEISDMLNKAELMRRIKFRSNLDGGNNNVNGK